MSFATTLNVTTPSDLEIVVERTFDAPPDLVFDCFTKPEFVRRWLTGPDDWTMPTCDIDLRPEGKYRYVWEGPDGTQMGMTGTFHEITPPEKLVSTEVFDDGFGMGKMLVTALFQAEGKGTKLRTVVLYQSKEERDAAVATGMTEGMGMSYTALDRLLSELA